MVPKNVLLLFAILILGLGLSTAQVEYNNPNLPRVPDPIFSIETFLGLTDTPSSYSGQSSNCVKVAAGETTLEFGSCGVGGSNKGTNNFYLFNNTNTIFFNETTLNDTISKEGINIGFNNTANIFDQDLNTTNNVTFESVNATRSLIVGDGAGGSHTLDVHGDVEIEHTALNSDDHAVEIIVDAAGFGDVKGLFIDYITGAIVTGQDEEVILINIDEFLATGGDVAAVEVLATEGGAEIFGLEVGILVNPIEQLSGTFGNALICEVNGVDQSAACASTGTDVAIFENDNDFMIIGGPVKFQEIEFIFDTTASGAGIRPKFEFSTGATTWTEFNPTDGTSGARNNGVVFFLDSDVPTWATNGSDFLINITRTRNVLTTTPIEDKIQIASATEYFWDKLGYLSINNISVINGNIFSDDLSLKIESIANKNFDIKAVGYTVGTAAFNLTITGSNYAGSSDADGGNIIIEAGDGFISGEESGVGGQLWLKGGSGTISNKGVHIKDIFSASPNTDATNSLYVEGRFQADSISLFEKGLTVNELGGSLATDDFRAETNTEMAALFLDASTETLFVNVDFNLSRDDDFNWADYLSITTTTDQTKSADLKNIFDQANYASFDYVNNSEWRGITFDPSSGNFTIDKTGIYTFTINMVLELGGTASQVTYIVLEDGTTIYSHSVGIHPSVDPALTGLTQVRKLSEGSNLSFYIDATTSSNTIGATDGTTFSIWRIS